MRTLSRTKLFLFFILIFCISPYTFSAELNDQRRMFSSMLSDVEYKLPLGVIKKINAINVVEREIILRGDVQRSTYEFDRQISAKNAWLMTLDALPKNKQALFSCDALSCGSSNGWANDIFSIKQLYGLDQSQKFRAYALEDDINSFLAVYFVQRGNKRIYAQVDKIKALDTTQRVAPSMSVILKSLSEQGYYTLPVLSAKGEVGRGLVASGTVFDEKELQSLLSALRAKPISKFYLVGHSYSAQTLEENHQTANDYARALLDKIVAKRMSAKRFSVQSVANLAPNKALPVDRVSVVVRVDGT